MSSSQNLQKDLSIVIKTQRFEERHQIVTALTLSHGKITVLARNSVGSKRLGASLQLLTAGEWVWAPKETSDLYGLREIEFRHDYQKLKSHYQSLSIASILTEVIFRVAPLQEPCESLFKLFVNALSQLEDHPEISDQPYSFLNTFLFKILFWSGCKPQTLRCLKCERAFSDLLSDQHCRFDRERAGWICGDCGTGRTPIAAIWDLRVMEFQTLKHAIPALRATELQHERLFDDLYSALFFHIPGFSDQPLKSLKIFKSVPGTLDDAGTKDTSHTETAIPT